jgi:hypothetical protein
MRVNAERTAAAAPVSTAGSLEGIAIPSDGANRFFQVSGDATAAGRAAGADAGLGGSFGA